MGVAHEIERKLQLPRPHESSIIGAEGTGHTQGFGPRRGADENTRGRHGRRHGDRPQLRRNAWSSARNALK
jgi:hypothetical protein